MKLGVQPIRIEQFSSRAHNQRTIGAVGGLQIAARLAQQGDFFNASARMAACD